MKKEKNNYKRGFTLLELLVVVLIIGILAGIALPQYKVVVEKSRAMNLIILVKAVNLAEHRYFMEHGEYTNKFNALDIEMPKGVVQLQSSIRYKGFSCWFNLNASVHCKNLNTSLDIEKYWEQSYIVCWHGNSPLNHKVCKSLGGILYNNTSSNSYRIY